MATVDIKVPSPGESISEVRIAQWLVKTGDVVEKDQPIAEIDSDKATLELSAEEAGKIEILAEEDATVSVGDVVARIDTSVKPEKKAAAKEPVSAASTSKADKPAVAAAPVAANSAAATHATPVAKAVMADKGITADKLKGTGPQ